jgi:general secretion pathway protein B
VSFILDALRKSDARRQQSAAPGLNSPEPPRPPGRERRRRWPLFALVLVLVATAGAVVLMRPQWLPPGWLDESEPPPATVSESGPERPAAVSEPDGQGEDAAAIRRRMAQQHGTESGNDRRRMPPRPEQASPERETPAPDEARAVADQPRRVPVPASPDRVVRRQPEQPRESEPVRASEATAELERRMAEEAERRRRAESASREEAPADRRIERSGPSQEAEASAESPTPAEPAPPLNDGVSDYVRAWELPLSVRRNLPELDLSIHVFSPEASQRFVLINGERYVSGDSIGEARIVDIRREGAIVDFRSHRFLLEPR